MPKKRAFWWLADAVRLEGDGRSFAEIAEILKRRAKPGQKPPGKSTIFDKVREVKGGAAVLPLPKELPPPAPPPPPIPLDASPLEPEDVSGMLAGLMRMQRDLVERLMADGDVSGAGRASRLATTIATQIGKQQAREEDGDVVRVRQVDMSAAAERARSKLHDLAARLTGERP